MKTSTALVTGGAGFIGSNLARTLLRTGYAVTILDNFSSGSRDNLSAVRNARIVEGDVRDERAVDRAIDGADVVFHLAASVGNKRSIDSPVQDAEINVIGTLNLLQAIRRRKIRKLVVASSAGIFGELRTLPIREDHSIEPDSPYGATKLCEEKQCLAYGRMYDFDCICLRYFNVYGPGQRFDAYGNVIPIFTFQLLRGQSLTVFGDGEQTRDFVSVHDVVRVNILAAQADGVSGAFNIGSGASISINRLIEKLAQSSGIPPRVVFAPPRTGDVRHSLADVTAARVALGYEPSANFDDGLLEYVAWARTSEAGLS